LFHHCPMTSHWRNKYYSLQRRLGGLQTFCRNKSLSPIRHRTNIPRFCSPYLDHADSLSIQISSIIQHHFVATVWLLDLLANCRAQETIQTDVRRQHRVHRWAQLLGLRKRRGISWSDGQLPSSLELRSQELGTAMMLNDLEWNGCGVFKGQQNLDVRDFDLSWLVPTNRIRPHGWANGFPTVVLLRRPLLAKSRWRLRKSPNVLFYLYRIPGVP
jgi:hypothetical protein